MPRAPTDLGIDEGPASIRSAAQSASVTAINEFRTADRKAEISSQAAIDNCMRTGSVMKALFPEGLRLEDEEEFAIFRLFDRLVGDVAQFARTGMTRSACLRDISLHAMLLENVVASREQR
jgi:hypothetical protein